MKRLKRWWLRLFRPEPDPSIKAQVERDLQLLRRELENIRLTQRRRARG